MTMTIERITRAAFAFLAQDSGVTAIEYALLGALIAAVIVTGVGTTGTAVEALYEHVSSCVGAAASGASAQGC